MTRRTQIAARLMVACFVLWQTSALLHLVLDTHVILADGSIARLNHKTGEPLRESRGNEPDGGGCPVVNQLTTANAIASQDIVSTYIFHIEQAIDDHQYDVDIRSSEELYRLSPSNSPPPRSR